MPSRRGAGIPYVKERTSLRELMVLSVILTIVVVVIYISFS
jgi:hypothetical protein